MPKFGALSHLVKEAAAELERMPTKMPAFRRTSRSSWIVSSGRARAPREDPNDRRQ